MKTLFLATTLAMAAGCGPFVQGSAVATSGVPVGAINPAAVRVGSLAPPPNGVEIGIVQARTESGSIEDLFPEFRRQVAQLGGDFGKIDEVDTHYEMKRITRTETYQCGTQQSPQTCTRTVTTDVEVATTQMLGRAFRTR